MRTKSFICVLTAVCLLLTGCGKNTQKSDKGSSESSEASSSKTVMQLLFSATDSFNPYTAATAVNRELCELLYDPLIKVDNKYNPVNYLAAQTFLDGTECRITLKDALFSDGSAVTAEDVVYSCNLARSTAGAISAALYEVSSVKAADSKTVVFSLTRRDPYFLNLLDFPILKAGSDKVTDVDGVLQPPIGCGRFVLDNSHQSLKLNSGYYGKKPEISEIRLINSPDAESIGHYVEVGATDAYFTETADGGIVRMSGKKTDVNLNDLVYIGINDKNALLSVTGIRYAISSAIDRTELSKYSFYNNAVAANGFFNPDFKDTSAVQTIKNVSDFEIAIENLEEIGYNRLDSEGYRINSSGYRLGFNLLTNSQNASSRDAAARVKESLRGVGIFINIVERPYAEYLAALQGGSFELYIGAARILPNMDISPLVLPGGSMAYGINPPVADPASETPAEPSAVMRIFDAYYSGTAGLADISAVLQTELPLIPLCYREGLLFYDSSVCNLEGASISDIYFSLEKFR